MRAVNRRSTGILVVGGEINKLKRRKILFEDGQLGPFPMHRLKHVDRPTTLITDKIQRVDVRENAFDRAGRGDFGVKVKRELPRLTVKYPLSAAQTDVMLHLGAVQDNEVADTEAPIPRDPKILSRHIKRLGYFLGADVMGICHIPEYAVYSHDVQGNPIDITYKYAIVIVTSKEYESVNASKGDDWIGDPLSFQAYMRAAFAAHTMADYIRRLGYPAVPQHAPLAAGRYQVLIPPLLLWAGIGEMSRAGIILNPFLGLAFKASAVLTNMPLEPDKPIVFGLQDFCQHCKICASACPSNAIPTGNKVMYNGYETWKLDERRCASYNVLNKQGTICNTCVKVCPWTRPHTWPHNLVRWAIQRSSIARSAAIRTEYILGREKAKGIEDKQWWFDLEYDADGFLRIPRYK